MAQLTEFLNPKSMITPGVAGGLTMVIANSLWWAFAWQQRYTGLILSFLFALLVLIGQTIPMWHRLLFWVLNGLVIFSVAVGANAAGVASPPSSRSHEAAVATFVLPTEVARLPAERWTEAILASDPKFDAGAVAALGTAIAGKSSSAKGALSEGTYHVRSSRFLPTYALTVQGDSVVVDARPSARTLELARVTTYKHPFFVPWLGASASGY